MFLLQPVPPALVQPTRQEAAEFLQLSRLRDSPVARLLHALRKNAPKPVIKRRWFGSHTCSTKLRPWRQSKAKRHFRNADVPSALLNVGSHDDAFLVVGLSPRIPSGNRNGSDLRLSVGAPCFSRGSWTSVQRKTHLIFEWL